MGRPQERSLRRAPGTARKKGPLIGRRVMFENMSSNCRPVSGVTRVVRMRHSQVLREPVQNREDPESAAVELSLRAPDWVHETIQQAPILLETFLRDQ